jgi:hypothetical protein
MKKELKKIKCTKTWRGEEFSKCLCFLASKILHWIHNSQWLALWNNKFEFSNKGGKSELIRSAIKEPCRMDDVLVGNLLMIVSKSPI